MVGAETLNNAVEIRLLNKSFKIIHMVGFVLRSEQKLQKLESFSRMLGY